MFSREAERISQATQSISLDIVEPDAVPKPDTVLGDKETTSTHNGADSIIWQVENSAHPLLIEHARRRGKGAVVRFAMYDGFRKKYAECVNEKVLIGTTKSDRSKL
jgi:hypothetical protein